MKILKEYLDITAKEIENQLILFIIMERKYLAAKKDIPIK